MTDPWLQEAQKISDPWLESATAVLEKPKEQPAGFVETFKEVPWYESVPITGGVITALETWDLYSAAKRLSTEDYARAEITLPSGQVISPPTAKSQLQKADDQILIENYLIEQERKARKGRTWLGTAAAGIRVLPAWMGEFLLTGGLAALGKKGAIKAGQKLLGRYAKRKAAMVALKTGGWLSGAAARTTLGMPHRVAAATLERRLQSELGADDQNWATAIAKGWGEVFIEAASEEAGGAITRGLGRMVNKLPFGKRFVSALYKAWRKIQPKGTKAAFMNQLFTKGGYSNLIGEIGEERLATIMHAIANTQDFGVGKDANVIERLMAGMQQDVKNFPSELIVLGTPAAGRFAVGRMVGEAPTMPTKPPVPPVEAITPAEPSVVAPKLVARKKELKGLIDSLSTKYDMGLDSQRTPQETMGFDIEKGTPYFIIGTKNATEEEILTVMFHEMGHLVPGEMEEFLPLGSKISRELTAWQEGIELAQNSGFNLTPELIKKVNPAYTKYIKLLTFPEVAKPITPARPTAVAPKTPAEVRIERRAAKIAEIKGRRQATAQQKAKAHIIARQKGLISEKGKMKPAYRRFAKAMTGKPSMKKMTRDEAEHLIDMLPLLIEKRGGGVKVPTTKAIITKELADKIDKFRDIGALEGVREARRVFRKIGLEKEVFGPTFKAEILSMEELVDFRKEATRLQKTVDKSSETSQKLFRALENPGSVKLTVAEDKVVRWGRKFYDKWADRLNLPAELRRKNYITHIFEREISEQIKQKYPLDPDLVKALEFITPKTIFNPYLQKRLGKTTGLKEDFWEAIQAYENRALKKFYYEPIIQRVRIYQKFLPPNSARYLKNYILRMTGRPLTIDREINQTLREAGEIISKLPGGERLAQHLTRGNAGGMIAYNVAGIYYEAWLGLRPASAIKNLSQHGLALAETGPVAFSKALATIGKNRTDLLAHSWVLRSRKLGFLPGIDETFIRKLESKRRKVTMAMFKAADRRNVSDAFLAGYHEAKAKGLSDEWAYRRGDEVAADTQYLYSKFAGSQLSQTIPGRLLGVLTTWPRNWAELTTDWFAGKRSGVYQEYKAETGQTVTPTNWLMRRKALFLYLAMVSLAMLIQKRTRFKALYYTGWTSIGALADIAAGKLAGLRIPAIIANFVAGLLLNDKRKIKQSWNEMRRFVVIEKELEDIISGKKDWMNLFIYLEKKKKKKRKKRPL